MRSGVESGVIPDSADGGRGSCMREFPHKPDKHVARSAPLTEKRPHQRFKLSTPANPREHTRAHTHLSHAASLPSARRSPTRNLQIVTSGRQTRSTAHQARVGMVHFDRYVSNLRPMAHAQSADQETITRPSLVKVREMNNKTHALAIGISSQTSEAANGERRPRYTQTGVHTTSGGDRTRGRRRRKTNTGD